MTAHQRAVQKYQNSDKGRERKRAWYIKNKERSLRYSKEYHAVDYASDPNKYRNRKLRRLYGIDVDEYNALLFIQNGGCAVCGKTQETTGKSLPVDHDHVTGKIRGILCARCNKVLGAVVDDIVILAKMINYLERNKNEPTRSVGIR